MAIVTRGDISAKRSPKKFIIFHVLIVCLSMVVTPKKVVQSDLFCFLCASTLGKDRVRIFGKRSVDIPGLIKSAVYIDVTEFSLSKLDVLAAKHDQPLKDAKETITAENSKLKELKEQAAGVAHVCSDTCLEQCLQGQVSSQAKESVKQHQMACHPGFTIAFDNIDLEINAKNMTMCKQNRDVHWVNHKMFVNRVSGNSLAHEGPRCDLSLVSNCRFCLV